MNLEKHSKNFLHFLTKYKLLILNKLSIKNSGEIVEKVSESVRHLFNFLTLSDRNKRFKSLNSLIISRWRSGESGEAKSLKRAREISFL